MLSKNRSSHGRTGWSGCYSPGRSNGTGLCEHAWSNYSVHPFQLKYVALPNSEKRWGLVAISVFAPPSSFWVICKPILTDDSNSWKSYEWWEAVHGLTASQTLPGSLFLFGNKSLGARLDNPLPLRIKMLQLQSSALWYSVSCCKTKPIKFNLRITTFQLWGTCSGHHP